MAGYICLLRAIGPVTHAKMSMAALREKCGAVGFQNVETLLNTGNLLLASELAAARVRDSVQEIVDGFGIASEVFIRTPRQLAQLVQANPLVEAAADHPSAFGVCFFHRTPQWPEWLQSYDGPERLAPVGSHLCIDYGSGMVTSKFNVEKLLGARMTMRNWNTVVKLAARARNSAGP